MAYYTVTSLILYLLVLLNFIPALASAQSCQRIISLAPTVTETIFELGLSDRLIGVTTFCDYPEEAKKIAQLGSYFDTNLEKALSLKTDLVIGLPESRLILQKFSANGIPVLEINNRSVEQIILSYNIICQQCACAQKAQEIQQKLRAETDQIKQSSAAREHQKAAVLVASTVGTHNTEFYLSGNDGYYSSLLNILNISNVVTGNTFAIPGASFESLIALNPDIIFSIASRSDNLDNALVQIKKYLPNVKLIELNQDYAGKPGPRFIKLLKDMQAELDKELKE